MHRNLVITLMHEFVAPVKHFLQKLFSLLVLNLGTTNDIKTYDASLARTGGHCLFEFDACFYLAYLMSKKNLVELFKSMNVLV